MSSGGPVAWWGPRFVLGVCLVQCGHLMFPFSGVSKNESGRIDLCNVLASAFNLAPVRLTNVKTRTETN